ncbi:hypothetical protein ANO14919_109690 [Xylariales sp. No.14919]|nr:hypothetical protein ANO14919_109690 [Xylariales sp. No.14919]
MEDDHRYERDIVYTEKGLFGLTAMIAAEEGTVVALIGGMRDLQLLRRRTASEEIWYELVDVVATYGWAKENVTKLEHLGKNLTPTRLKIR